MTKTADSAAPAWTREQLVSSLAGGERRFHELPKDMPAAEAAAIRLEALEQIAQSPLVNIGHYSLDVQRAAKRNCENFFGVAQIPMGVVGPLSVRGLRADGDFYIPLATTEAALVASTNRGCAALREAGGAIVRVEDIGMTRAPVFRTSGIVQTQDFIAWIQEHKAEIRELCEGTSNHLRLIEIRPYAFGTTVFLRFRFDTGDAMGMNMVTIACDRAVNELIEPGTGVPCIGLSGNYCVDKKPAAINWQEGRGRRIYAEVLLDGPILHHILKTNSRELVEVQYRKNLLGSIAAGSMGFNAHYANVLSAFFIATGQDPAHVVEGSMGITCIEPRGPESVFASIYMPDVPLGAVGGGTSLDTQREALSILGVSPDPERPGEAVTKLAEILGAVVLAGELSLMAAFTSNDLARAHEKLARGGELPRRPPLSS